MPFVRGRLRFVATAWLLLQVAWLAALVPRDCCAAHQRAARSCHEAVTAVYCPMRSADGMPCPMHRAQHGHDGHHRTSNPAARDECQLRGTCDGPMAALVTMLSAHGVLPESTALAADAEATSVIKSLGEHVLGRIEPPDLPPPRA